MSATSLLKLNTSTLRVFGIEMNLPSSSEFKHGAVVVAVALVEKMQSELLFALAGLVVEEGDMLMSLLTLLQSLPHKRKLQLVLGLAVLEEHHKQPMHKMAMLELLVA